MILGKMALIGAALPRTGTMSVKRALERLGAGRCYHMHDAALNAGHVEVWLAACEGKMPDWQSLLVGYSATLDVPACLYWKRLAGFFPDARVLLLRRDPELWYQSVLDTVYRVAMEQEGKSDPALAMVRRVFFDGYFDGRFEDRDHAIAVYCRYCEEVRQGVARERLLEYEVTQGWEPLCGFLGCDVPDEAFPHRNTRTEFQARNSRTQSPLL
jgi:hypothetical protein